MSSLRALWQDQIPPGRASARAVLVAVAKSALVVRHASTFLFRLSQAAGGVFGPAGTMVKQVNHVLTGADIAWQASIGPGLILNHPTGVVIGPGVSIGSRCRIQQGVTIGGRGGSNTDGSPVIGDDVELGTGSKVLGPMRIADGCVVGANAVVVRNHPDAKVLVGIPARPAS